MAAPTLAELMQGLEDRLQTISGLRTAAFLADAINPPMAIVGVSPVDNYHQTMGRGRMDLSFSIYILVSGALDRVGQMALAGYANPTGATSIVSALYGDKTLGGKAEDIHVRSFRPLGTEEVNLIGYFGGLFDVRVIALGS